MFFIFHFLFLLFVHLVEQKIRFTFFIIFYFFVNCLNLDFWALYGLLVVAIVLVAKNCVERSFSELWKIRISSLCEDFHVLNGIETALNGVKTALNGVKTALKLRD